VPNPSSGQSAVDIIGQLLQQNGVAVVLVSGLLAVLAKLFDWLKEREIVYESDGKKLTVKGAGFGRAEQIVRRLFPEMVTRSKDNDEHQ
jgi:hypothetical protein